MKRFYLYLVSSLADAKLSVAMAQSNNILFDYSTPLHNTIDTSHGPWYCAVHEIFYPRIDPLSKNKFEITYLYSDLVRRSYVGTKEYQILRSFVLEERQDSVNFSLNKLEFYHPLYLPVDRTRIDIIQLKFDSPSNHPLPIKDHPLCALIEIVSGHPSLELEYRMASQGFFLFIPSDPQSGDSNNTPTKFKVKLNTPRQLIGEYEIALIEMIAPPLRKHPKKIKLRLEHREFEDRRSSISVPPDGQVRVVNFTPRTLPAQSLTSVASQLLSSVVEAATDLISDSQAEQREMVSKGNEARESHTASQTSQEEEEVESSDQSLPSDVSSSDSNQTQPPTSQQQQVGQPLIPLVRPTLQPVPFRPPPPPPVPPPSRPIQLPWADAQMIGQSQQQFFTSGGPPPPPRSQFLPPNQTQPPMTRLPVAPTDASLLPARSVMPTIPRLEYRAPGPPPRPPPPDPLIRPDQVSELSEFELNYPFITSSYLPFVDQITSQLEERGVHDIELIPSQDFIAIRSKRNDVDTAEESHPLTGNLVARPKKFFYTVLTVPDSEQSQTASVTLSPRLESMFSITQHRVDRRDDGQHVNEFLPISKVESNLSINFENFLSGPDADPQSGNLLLIQCSQIRPCVAVGSKTLPLLRAERLARSDTFAQDMKSGRYYHYQFQNLVYLPLNVSLLSEIEISLTDARCRPLLTPEAKSFNLYTQCHLHIRPRREQEDQY